MANIGIPQFVNSADSGSPPRVVRSLVSPDLATLMPKWRVARANVLCGVADAKIAFIGDSTTRGQGAGTTTAQAPNAYPVQVAALLNSAGLTASAHNLFGTGNATLGSFDSRVTLTGSFTTSAVSVGAFPFRMATTANVAFLPPANVDSFDIYHINNGTGQFTINVNGGATKATVNTTTSGTIVKTSVTDTLGSNTLNIVWVSGTCYPHAIDAWNSASKTVRCWNMGWLSSTSANWARGSGAGTLFEPTATLQNYIVPDVCIIDVGINDWSTSLNPQTYRDNLQVLITACKVNSDVVLKTPVPSQTTSTLLSAQMQYVDMIYDLAAYNSVPVIDIFSRFSSYETGNALGFYTDSKHPTRIGYSDIANTVARFLLTV